MNNIDSQSLEIPASDAPVPVENSSSSFLETVASVKDSRIPIHDPSNSEKQAFIRSEAFRDLDGMEERGKDLIKAEEIKNKAMRTVEGLAGVTPEVVEASGEALEASIRFLEKKASHAHSEGAFWANFSRLCIFHFPNDLADEEKERAKRTLGAAVDTVRETGEFARAMTAEAEGEHIRKFTPANLILEQALEVPRKLTLREKIFNYSNEKMNKAFSRSESYKKAVRMVESNIPSLTGKIEKELRNREVISERILADKLADVHRAQAAFGRATRKALDSNYKY